MNKALLVFIFLIAALTLSAQTGLIDLSYGMTKAVAIAHLSEKGFTAISDDGETVSFTAPKSNVYIESVDLVFAANVLNEWTIIYLKQKLENIDDLVMEALIARHGEDYYWFNDLEMYEWSLGEGHWALSGWDHDKYWVTYTTD